MNGSIYERPDWPQFRWNSGILVETLIALRFRQGRLLGRMESLGFPLRAEANLESLTQDIVKSSEIEGEMLESEQVRSSIARRLGIDIGGLVPADRNVEGVVEMMLEAIQQYSEPLSVERLYRWHASLFPTGRSGLSRIRVGAWRDDSSGPMQVVSGAMGYERIRFQAPPALLLDEEMEKFLAWFNSETGLDPVLKAAIAHLWFVTLHPFDDGNGRIARTIADMALARSEGSSQRFYSMSAQIRQERNAYYHILEQSQKGSLDITPWLEWFLGCLDRAFNGSEETLASALRKARFWEVHAAEVFNERQRAMLNRLLDGLEGNLTSSKWARMSRCSQDTALRDITDLVERQILLKAPAQGRSSSYLLDTGETANPDPAG